MYSFNARVRYSEVGGDRKLSLPGVVNYLQDCSTFQSEDLKMGIDYLELSRRAWWLSSWQIVMERYPRLGEEIVVSTWPYAFKGMYGYRNFTIRDRQGAFLAKANSVWFLFDTAAGRPVKVGEEDIRGYKTGEEEKLDMEYAPRRISLPEAYWLGEPVKVARHHIDTNCHMNNAQYVAVAREALPENLRIREVRVEYKKAAVMGDVMIPRISQDKDIYVVALCSREDIIYAVVWMQAVGA
ncbi:acyl-[acyl-carrier-protein] thioesterase [Clostridiaceae bacterium]|nr:acyl-[acyl-carrier-protein] thioesterase [Clostridiaceae bacterium]RKI18420.1 acyl-[acyl-carrier-protein] thioesterase [bacterium 1XD21-70]